MRSHTHLPSWRTGLGTVLAILAGIVWFVLISQALLDLLPPHHLTLLRAETSVALAVLLVVGAAVALRDWSMFWQVSLQATAAGGLVAGVNLSGAAAVLQLASTLRRCWPGRDHVDSVGPNLGRADATLAGQN